MRLQRGDELVFATHNAGKLAEMTALLVPRGITVLSSGALGLPEPAETETTFAGNARIKAHAAAQASGRMALADDSGLCVDALDGAPGVFTADWAEAAGGRDFGLAMRRVRDAVAASPPPWTARFRATLVLADPAGTDAVFEGALEGQVVWPPRGNLGHGYDPMFQPAGLSRTMAELSAAEKNALSHRGVAVRALLAACFT